MRFIILVSVLAIFPLIMSASYLSLIETNDNQTLIRYNIDKQLVSFDGAFPEMCTNDNQDSFILNNYHLPVLHTFLQIPNGHKAILSIKNPSYEEVYHQKLSKIDDDVIYLNSHVLVSDPFIMRNNLLTTLSIQPYVYYPDETKVVMLKEADIIIRYIPDSVYNIERKIKQSKEFKDWLSKATINYRDYARLGNADGSILIVYNQTASPLSLIQPLIDWKHQKGWVVNAVSTTVTGTTTAGIKNYIQNAYNTWANPPEYILLIGRAIQSNNVPTYTEYYNYSTVGDYKYTLLEGSDIIPDVYIGRLTFASTDQLSSMINKIIAYEKRQGLASNNWFNSSLLVSDETDSGHSCTITLQYVRDLMLEYNPSSQNTFVNSGTIPSQIYSALNQGVSNFYYRGFNGYSGMTNTDIGNLLNTGKYPFISLITCFSGNFGQTSQLSIGEQFMRIGTTSAPKGAIGFIGSSCETHTCLNNIMTGSIAYGFYKEKLTNQGQALLRAKLGLYACYPQNPANYIQQNFQSLNLLGDPSLDIWLKQPLDLVIHNSTTANAVNGYLQVQATDSFGIPVSQAKVCILKGNDEIFQVGYTNSNGYVVLNWNQATNGIATLTVSKAGYAPHQSSVVIDEQVVPFTISNISAFEQLMSGAYYSLPLSLTNHYYSALLNVTAIFSSQSEYVSIVSGTVSFGNMAFNQTLTSLQNVEFRISKQCPHNENLAFSLRVIGYYNDDQISFDLHFQVSEGGPDLAIIDYQIGTDNIIIPGVSTNLYIKIKNFGNVTATGINATIYSFNPNVTLSQINQPYNNLFPQYSTLNSTPYIIETNANLYSGTPLLIWVDVTYNNGASQLMTLTINVGSSTQTAMTGPDDYGYICVASGDNHPLAQPYNWIEIDPAFGGGGTLLALTDNDTEGSGSFATVQIPFTFKYYGVAYNEITICSNGFLMPGTQGSNEWMNWQIPGPMVPRPIIAPFWDDLIIGTTSKILYKYDSVNDKFIVEWSNMRNRYNQQVLETFQVVIYSMTSYHTQTSDNAILFQYKAFNNVDAGNYGVSHIDHGQYSTVGIADHTGMVGLQYTFQNQYPPTAAPITNNSTLLFITTLNQNYTPVLVYHSYQFSEAIPVFNNNQINSGETISISPIINNAGPTTLSPSSVILSTASDYATVVSSVSAISEIVALQNTGVNSPFLIQITEDCPNLTEIVFELTIMNVLYTYHLNFSVIVHSPQVTFSDIMLNGNPIHYLEPGQTAQLSMEISNNSAIDLDNAVFTFNSDNTWIPNPAQFILNLPASSTYTLNFILGLNNNTAWGEVLNLTGLFSINGIYSESFSADILAGELAEIFTCGFNNTQQASDWTFSNGVSIMPATYISDSGYEVVIHTESSGSEYSFTTPAIYAYDSQLVLLSFKYQNFDTSSINSVLVSYNNFDTWYNLMYFSEYSSQTINAECILPNLPSDLEKIKVKWLFNTANAPRGLIVLDDILVKAIHHPKGFVSGSVSLDYNPQLVSQVKISASTHPDIYVYPDQYGQYTLPLYQGNYAFIKAELDNFMPAVITDVAIVSNQTTDVPITMNYLRRPVAISYQIESNLLHLNWELESLNNSALPTKVGTRFSSKLRLTPEYYKIWIMHNQQTVVDTTGAQAYQTLLESGSYELYIKSVYLAYDGTEVYSAQSETLSFINTSAPELPQPPIVFGLEQNYPNPFTNSTIIRYSLSKTSETSLSVYNIKGELVRTLVKSEQKSGKYQIEFNGLDNKSRALPSGVYFYRLAAGRQTITHKLVILK